MSRILNRRNALLGWAAWNVARQWARRRAKETLHREPPRWRRRLRRLGTMLAAVAAALGLVALWRKLRGGEEEWEAPEPLDAHRAEATPLSSVEPDDDVPPAA